MRHTIVENKAEPIFANKNSFQIHAIARENNRLYNRQTETIIA